MKQKSTAPAAEVTPLKPSKDGTKWENDGGEANDSFKFKQEKVNEDPDESGNMLDDGEEAGDGVPPILKYIAKMKAFNANTNLFMKNLPPESTASMIVVPMNKHGDGYLVSSYDSRYLKGKMSKAEF
jgi:hypothetical protein